MANRRRKICFEINEHDWIILTPLLGKIIIRAHKFKKCKKHKGRTSDKNNQHRAFEYECEGSVKIKPKIYDISKFIIEE